MTDLIWVLGVLGAALALLVVVVFWVLLLWCAYLMERTEDVPPETRKGAR